MDHEGPFGVRVTVDGPLGRAAVDSQVDATYDLRPAPGLIALYLVPFVLRRRRCGSRCCSRRARASVANDAPKANDCS